MKFSTKLVLLAFGLVLASGAIMAYLYGTASRRFLERQIVERLEDRGFHAMDKLSRYFYERYNEVGALASEPLLTSKMASPQQIAALLSEHLSWRREYASAAFYDKDRVLVADTAPERVGEQADLESVWGEGANGRDFIIAVSAPGSNLEPMLLLAYFVRDGQGAARGLLISRLPLEIIVRLVGGVSGAHDTEEPLGIDLIDDKGLTLYSNYVTTHPPHTLFG